MPIRFFCSHCGTELQAAEANQQVTCPNCNTVSAAPAPAAAPTPPPVAAPPPAAPPAAPPVAAPPPAAPPPAAPPVYAPPPAQPAAPPPMYAQPVQPQVAPVQPAMPQQPVYAPPPAAAPPAAPKKKSACFTTCCVGSVILGLLAVIAGILAYVYVLPRVQAQTYVTQVRPLHAAAIAKIEALQDDPAIKKLNSVTINDSNFGSTTKTMIDLAAVCTDARHSADAVADKLGKIQAPPNLKELHAALIDYYTSVTTSLNEIEPQVDYMALVLDAWQRSIKGLSEAQSGSSSNLDQIATQLDTLRGKLKETHDTLMVKSAPPGSEDLHKAMLKSLEELSDLLSQMSSALRNRQLSQLVSLARSAESRANGAAKRLETGFTAWGTKMSSKFDTLSATLTEKENQVNLRVKAVNEKLKLTGDQALPLFKEEAKK